MHVARLRTLAVAALVWIALAGTAIAQKPYENEQYGFKMRIPKGFHSVPINMAETWVVAKFLYKRSLAPKKASIWIEKTPEIRVIIFPKVDVKAVAAARTAEAKKIAVKDKDGKITYVNLLEYLQNPFRGYEEYLRENYKKGGWFVADEKKSKIGGLPAVFKLIEVDDQMGYGGKATISAWEIDYGDAIYVLQFEVIKDYDHKFRADVKSAAKKFRQIGRTQALRPTLTATRSTEREEEAVAAAKKETLSPDARRKAREADLGRAVEKATEAMQSGWSTYTQGPFTVFHSTKVEFARRVSRQAVMMWAWMDKNFDFVGEDHSVGSILRICKNRQEAQSYQETSTRSDVGMTVREIVLWDDKDWGWGDSGSGRLNATIARQYFADKNRRLWYGLPPWLDQGLQIYIGSLKMKGNKLVGKPDEWDMEAIRRKMRENKFKPSRDVLKANWETYMASRGDSSDRVQSLAIVNFLFETRQKKYRNALNDYIRALDKRLREFDKDKKGGIKLAGIDDEEIAKWLSRWNKDRDRVYDDCFRKVFGGWSKRAWAGFDRAWRSAY